MNERERKMGKGKDRRRERGREEQRKGGTKEEKKKGVEERTQLNKPYLSLPFSSTFYRAQGHHILNINLICFSIWSCFPGLLSLVSVHCLFSVYGNSSTT